MKVIGNAILPATIGLAVLNVVLAGARAPILVMEAFVICHAWIVACYWWNRAEGNPAEYFTEVVSDAWDGDPHNLDRVMVIPTIGTLLCTFAWMV
jgi:hypothetical protein